MSISFLDHLLFPLVPDHHLRFRLLEETHHFPFTEDLEVHLLELPKFNRSATELGSELEIWLYFLRHAETMDTEALPDAVGQHPVVRRAVEELKMLAQTNEERERYENRRKAQLDYNTAMKWARIEGRIEEKINTIHQLEDVLHRPATATEELERRTIEELSQLMNQLLAELRQGRGTP